MKTLCDLDYVVSLETSGALDISAVDQRVIKIVDVKTPDSNEFSRNCFENFNHLSPQDQIKFVICDRRDYEWAKDIIYSIAAMKKVSSNAYKNIVAIH